MGKTPIHWAAYDGHTEIVKFLVPLTEFMAKRSYPLLSAVCLQCCTIMKIILEFLIMEETPIAIH